MWFWFTLFIPIQTIPPVFRHTANQGSSLCLEVLRVHRVVFSVNYSLISVCWIGKKEKKTHNLWVRNAHTYVKLHTYTYLMHTRTYAFTYIYCAVPQRIQKSTSMHSHQLETKIHQMFSMWTSLSNKLDIVGLKYKIQQSKRSIEPMRWLNTLIRSFCCQFLQECLSWAKVPRVSLSWTLVSTRCVLLSQPVR